MLSFLKISNLAILDDVSIEPGRGLNVLTGETGAGKSILVDAIGLLLGGRGGSDLIRAGCDRLIVEGQFDLSEHPDARANLESAGLLEEPDARELILRRELLAEGRGRAMVNGRIVPLASLRRLGEILADLHGQHQHQSLLAPEGQRDALDRFAGAMDLRQQVSQAHEQLRSLLAERETLAGRERERARQEDMLRRQIAEIDAVAPAPSEEEDLSREESLLRNAEEVGRLAAQAHALVSEDDDSAIARLAAARERLERLAAIDPEAAQIRDQIEEARLTAAEAARGIAGYADAETFNPGRLERVAGRLADLDRLKRRYGATLQEVLAYRERAAGELSLLDRAADRLATIDADLEESESAYRRSAASLSDRRRQAAAVLEKRLRRELGDLAMEGTRVAIAVEAADPAERAAHGADRVEFLIAPNKGEPLRSLARIASGGELSRLMLALRNAAEARGDRRVLIFDEIDSGIGGRTAEVVGQRLAALASSQQVLCVTHLPQIAAFADRHFRVIKQEAAGRTQAMVAPLDREGRIDELARMLGGSPPQSARRHAAALVRQVGPGGPGKPSSPARGTRAQR